MVVAGEEKIDRAGMVFPYPFDRAAIPLVAKRVSFLGKSGKRRQASCSKEVDRKEHERQRLAYARRERPVVFPQRS